MSTVTEWFPMTVAPVYEGLYQLRFRYGGRTYWARWNNGEWKLSALQKMAAAGMTTRSDSAYNGEYIGWRGLAEKPEGFVA